MLYCRGSVDIFQPELDPGLIPPQQDAGLDNAEAMSTSADSHQWLRRGQSSTWLLFQYHTQTYSIHNADRSSQYHIRSHWNRLYIDTINCPRHILGRDKVFVIYTLSWVGRNEVFVIYYLQIMTWQKWALVLLNILLSWCIKAKQCLNNGVTYILIIHLNW